jgi:PAS domain S-box-containing protein
MARTAETALRETGDAGERVSPRERVLLDLARRDKRNVAETFRAISEASATVLEVSRVSIWALVPSNELPDARDERLVCKDLYLKDERRHTHGHVLLARDYPQYFRAIGERRVIAADRATEDPRTSEYSDSYLNPLGITSMLDAPIWYGGEIYGVLCHEHVGPWRHWTLDEQSFAIHMADIASLTLVEGARRIEERRIQAVVDSVAEGVVVVDAEGRIVHANPAGRRDFFERAGGGLTLEERLHLFQFLDANDHPLAPEQFPFARVMRGEVVENEIFGIVFRRTGERRYYRMSCSPIHEGDAIKYIVYVAFDVSDDIYFERLQREFIATLAHELKTPVAIVKGYSQHLGRSGAVSPGSRPMLGAIERTSERMERLIDALLDVSSVTLGRLVLTHELIDLVELARSAVERTARSAPEHLLELRAPERVQVLADRARLEQAIRRLVENAVRSSPGGGTVEVDIELDAGDVLLSVRDHGVGIPEDVQSRIFEMFFEPQHGSTLSAGTFGIGLFLAREIARRHGGEMWFESTEGHGSAFHMRLPTVEKS